MANILFTLNCPDRTGASKMAYLFSKYLRAAKHSIWIAHGPTPPVSQEGKAENYFEELKSIGVNLVYIPKLNQPMSKSVFTNILNLATQENISCIIGMNQRDRLVAILAAKYLNIPSAIHAGNLHIFHGGFLNRYFKRFSYNLGVKLVKLAVCTSEAVQNDLIENFGVEKKRTVVLANGIDIQTFNQDKLITEKNGIKDALGISPNDTVIINIGRIDEQKGLEYLLEGFKEIAKKYPESKLLHIGDITYHHNQSRMLAYRDKLTSYIASEGLETRVKLLGARQDIPDLLAISDIYCHSALWEGPALPLAVMEAMAAGLPTIITDCSGFPEGFEQGKQGYVVPKASGTALAEAMDKIMMCSATQRISMGKDAHELIKKLYDIDIIGGKFVGLIEKLIQNESRSHR